MFNLLKTSAVAAVIATAPMVASAATVVMSDGGTYVVTTGDVYLSNDIQGDGGAGMWQVKFIADTPASATVSASILADTLAAFDNLELSWLAADGMSINTVLAGPVPVLAAPVITTLSTDFTDPNMAQYLKVSWTSSTVGVDFDVVVNGVAAVPVPAAGLMLLTALGGAAAMRRRTKS